MVFTPLSSRRAADLLTDVGLTTRQARQVLDAGLAGAPVRTSAALLHDEAAVLALVERPTVELDRLIAVCPRGVVVSRLAPGVTGREIRHRMPTMSRMEIDLLARHLGFLPWVATVCGFVVRGGDLVGTHLAEDGRTELELAAPGAWFSVLRDHRFPTGPGRPWVWWGRGLGRPSTSGSCLRE